MKRVIIFYPGTVPVPANDFTETPHVGATVFRGGCKWTVKDVIYNMDAGLIKILLIP